MTLQELIEKLENVTVLDRDLDIAIARACPVDGWRVEHDGSVSAFDGEGWYSMPTEVPVYTHSIDAASTLVPYGWWLTLKSRGDYHHAELEYVGPGEIECSDLETDEVSSLNRPSPANAICIAALKARQAIATQTEDTSREGS